MNLPFSRPYRMVARAANVAATGERILDAAVEAFWERPTDEISLDDVARRAGVTVQTVIRRFGGKEGLFAAAVERESGRVRQERDPASVTDAAGAVAQLVAHYEARGDRVLRMLAEETRVPGLRSIADNGRRAHRDWCERVFASALVDLSVVDRSRRVAQLVAVGDVYTWKLLRRDAGLSRRQTELAMLELLQPLLEVP
ncbi:MAG: helix-turn-helix domain-containing protein [Ilumatobacteraceae bacterium]